MKQESNQNLTEGAPVGFTRVLVDWLGLRSESSSAYFSTS